MQQPDRYALVSRFQEIADVISQTSERIPDIPVYIRSRLGNGLLPDLPSGASELTTMHHKLLEPTFTVAIKAMVGTHPNPVHLLVAFEAAVYVYEQYNKSLA